MAKDIINNPAKLKRLKDFIAPQFKKIDDQIITLNEKRDKLYDQHLARYYHWKCPQCKTSNYSYIGENTIHCSHCRSIMGSKPVKPFIVAKLGKLFGENAANIEVQITKVYFGTDKKDHTLCTCKANISGIPMTFHANIDEDDMIVFYND